MIHRRVERAVALGARQKKACELLGISSRTLERWKAQQDDHGDRRRGPNTAPESQLSAQERREVLKVANSPEFRDLSPKQIVPLLADRGRYLASESSFYRVLRDEKQLVYRESSRPPTKRHKPPELLARGPNEVWSWDITYLKTDVRGVFLYLYLALDVWSRKIVAWEIHEEESTEHATRLLHRAYDQETVSPGSLTVHSDNGSPMKGATLLATLQQLGVATSFSRPSVSNDNPYSEAVFRTLKYRPAYPTGAFESIEEARLWVADFVRWYNTEHLHSAIGFVTPEDRHSGRDVALLEHRKRVYELARARHPERWSAQARNWDHIKEVRLNPDAVKERLAG